MASYMLTELPYQITYGTLHALQAAVGNDNCPSHAALWGVLGSALGLVFASIFFLPFPTNQNIVMNQSYNFHCCDPNLHI
jgi:hypothetical protein